MRYHQNTKGDILYGPPVSCIQRVEEVCGQRRE